MVISICADARLHVDDGGVPAGTRGGGDYMWMRRMCSVCVRGCDNPDYSHSYLFPYVIECAFVESISYGHFAITGRCCPTGVFFDLGRENRDVENEMKGVCRIRDFCFVVRNRQHHVHFFLDEANR
jgi:hypothetical protein